MARRPGPGHGLAPPRPTGTVPHRRLTPQGRRAGAGAMVAAAIRL